jgi:hypothetical protein
VSVLKPHIAPLVREIKAFTMKLNKSVTSVISDQPVWLCWCAASRQFSVQFAVLTVCVKSVLIAEGAVGVTELQCRLFPNQTCSTYRMLLCCYRGHVTLECTRCVLLCTPRHCTTLSLSSDGRIRPLTSACVGCYLHCPVDISHATVGTS